MAISTEDRNRAAELAEELFRITGRRFKEDGTSRTFLEIEERVGEMSDLLADLVIQKTAEDKLDPVQNDAPVCCPKCAAIAKYRDGDDDEVMILQTDHGEVQFLTEGHYCRRCRRSFFPSAG